MSQPRATPIPTSDRRSVWRWGLILIGFISVLYSITLQIDINGSTNVYAEDVGEFQNVLTQWGTAHPTGYPLYSLSGAIFTSLLRLTGTPPAAAASAYSAFLAVLILVALYLLLNRLQLSPMVAAATSLLLGVLAPFWFYASVAEVYIPLSGLIVVAFLIIQRWHTDGEPYHLYHLALTVGLAVGHHRLALLALPALMIYAGPLTFRTIRARLLRLVPACGIVLASFLVYLYLPIRAWTGARWIYDQPGTWDGFWRLVSAREFGALVKLPSDIDAFVTGLSETMDALITILSWPIFLAGAIGLILALTNRARRLISLSLITLAAVTVGFVALFPRAVFPPAALMPAMFALVAGVGFLAATLPQQRRGWHHAATVMLAFGVLALIVYNGPFIASMTHATDGRALIEDVARILPEQESDHAVIFSLWNPDLFALEYAHAVTSELAAVEVVDHRANVANLIDKDYALYTPALTFYFERRSLPWWDKRLGRAYLSALPGKLIRVSDRPILTEADLPPTQSQTPEEQPITLRAWNLEPNEDSHAWQLSLYWQATSQVSRDYSVFVHLSDREVIDGPDAIIAQADSAAPVYGWYPTSRWSIDEIVRDEYWIQSPSDRRAKIVAVGLYYQDESGAFHNLSQYIIALP